MKVLVPVDGSKYSTEALNVAVDYAKTKGAEIYVMNVIPHISDVDLELTAADRELVRKGFERRGEDLLKKSKELLGSQGVSKITTVLLKGASPAREIVEYAKQEKIALIIIGSRGITEEARFLLGMVIKVTRDVVEHAPCSVYVVKLPQ